MRRVEQAAERDVVTCFQSVDRLIDTRVLANDVLGPAIERGGQAARGVERRTAQRGHAQGRRSLLALPPPLVVPALRV
jgi:hypothetical protein